MGKEKYKRKEKGNENGVFTIALSASDIKVLADEEGVRFDGFWDGKFPYTLIGAGECEGHKGRNLKLVRDSVTPDGKSATYFCSHSSHSK